MPARITSVTRLTPIAILSSVLRRWTAMRMPSAASTKETTGTIHLNFTITLNQPENFATWSFDTTVRPRLSPVANTALRGLNTVMPRELALSIT